MLRGFLFRFFVLGSLLCAISSALAIEDPGKTIGSQDVTIQPILGNKVDLSLEFRDSSGKLAPLSEFMLSSRPALIVPVYYHCPRLCGFVLSGVVDLLRDLELGFGSDYKVLAVSFDHEEQPPLANERRQHYLEILGKGDSGWDFLVGSENNVKTLMKQIGFNYMKDGSEFAHGSAIIMLTPDGEISQYFTGIEFPAWDVKLALVEASKGNIGSPLDHVMLFCFRFDPTKGKYTWAAMNIVRAGGLLTLGLLAFLIIKLWRRDRRLAQAGA